MGERIDSYLDGTLDWKELKPDEQERARVAKRVIDETRAFVASRQPPDLTAAVIQRAHELGTPPRPSVWRRLEWMAEDVWTPRHLELMWRPVYALVAAAAVVLLVALLPQVSGTPAPGPSAVNSDAQLFVQFRLDVADAMDVRLAGSFTNWEPRYELHETAPGVWTITLPLAAGVHDYAFLVNGQRWMSDPYASQVDDGFGGVNSRIAIVPPEPPRL